MLVVVVVAACGVRTCACVCVCDKLWQRVQGDFAQCSYYPYSLNGVQLFLPVFMCSSAPMIASMSAPVYKL